MYLDTENMDTQYMLIIVLVSYTTWTSDMQATGGTVPLPQVGSELIILSIMVDPQTPCL